MASYFLPRNKQEVKTTLQSLPLLTPLAGSLLGLSRNSKQFRVGGRL